MSYDRDECEPCLLYKERHPKARRDHKCSCCSEIIRAGVVYTTVAFFSDGEFTAIKRCMRCQKIFEHLNSLSRDTCPDMFLDCGHDYKEQWGTEPPPEIAALAFSER